MQHSSSVTVSIQLILSFVEYSFGFLLTFYLLLSISHSAPTIASTFGSTPTVSKETTGPPTMYAGRERSQFKTDVTTDCREIIGGHPVVCVKVCTAITSIFDGDILIDETAETTEEECD